MAQPNIDKMYTYLRGYLVGANMKESLKALGYAREKHSGQFRKGGDPYIVHPLSMACYAVALGIKDDNVIATVLLHDVAEDCGVTIENLPFNDTIKRGVRYMTVVKFDGEEKAVTKKRYFTEMIESREAVICKGIDRYNNLSTMAGEFTTEAIVKNILETDEYILPLLKQAKDKWPDLSDLMFILRTNIRFMNDTLRAIYLTKIDGE